MIQGLVEEDFFSFYLGDADNDYGELTLGGYNPNRFTGNITWEPLISETYWEFNLQQCSVGGATFISGGGDKAIVDTGTSVLTGPSSVVANIAAQLGFKSIIDGEYLGSCKGPYPDIVFTIGGVPYTLTQDDYLIPDGALCILGMIALDIPEPAGPLWILGDTFIRKYYSIFDLTQKRLGFALAKHN